MTLEHLDVVIAFVVIITGVSVLVTILTQTISSILGLRGINLYWGLQTLLGEVDPNLKGHAAAISKAVLHHSLISDSMLSGFASGFFNRWKFSSAIRKDELIDILHMLAGPAQAAEAAKLGVAGAAVENAPAWQVALAAALDNLDSDAVAKILVAAPEIRKLLPDDPAKADHFISLMTTSTEHLTGRIDQWFDSMMDRVSQRFVMHTRIWTIIFSVLIAFACHLDALKILTQLSTDAELRARLAASADSLTSKADEMSMTSASIPASAYVDVMKQLIDTHVGELSGLAQPAGFTDLAGGKAWLTGQLKAAGIQDPDPWLQKYQTLVQGYSLRTAAADLRSILDDKLKFQLVPDPYPKPFYNYWTPSWLHLWGILATAALLSLGAPFWFNMLKTLTNLRPILANKQQQEQEDSG